MVRGTSGWVCGMSIVAGCVSGGFCIDGADTDVVGTGGCGGGGSGATGSVAGSGLGSGGGEGEWSGVIGVVGMWSGVRSSICGGYPSGTSKNRSSISRLISSMFSSSPSLAGSLEVGRVAMSVGTRDVVRLATTSAVLSGFLTNVDFKISTVLSLWGIWLG